VHIDDRRSDLDVVEALIIRPGNGKREIIHGCRIFFRTPEEPAAAGILL